MEADEICERNKGRLLGHAYKAYLPPVYPAPSRLYGALPSPRRETAVVAYSSIPGRGYRPPMLRLLRGQRILIWNNLAAAA